MRTLVGIVAYGSQKDYVVPKFLEMKQHCMDVEGVDFAWATGMAADQAAEVYPGDLHIEMPAGCVFVEDMLIIARDAFRRLAMQGEYDKVCYQGIDCLWRSRDDFLSVMHQEVDVVSALTSARTDSNAAVARRFESRHHVSKSVSPDTWGEKQYDIPDEELMAGDLVWSGFPGADAIFFDSGTFGVDWDEHVPWYRRVEQGRPNLDCMEYLCMKLMNKGFRCFVDTSVRVWHVHEDRVARMWKGIEVPLSDLSWN